MNNKKACSSRDGSKRGPKDKSPDEVEQQVLDRLALTTRMDQIEHKVMVLSGKGGVGKSTVAVNLATALALSGKRVGLLDIDIHGPSVPKLLHIEGSQIEGSDHTIYPVKVGYRPGIVNVMSIGFMLRNRDEAVIWRGPRKYNMIKQFLRDVEWGKLDYLIVDSPPGTGDEPLSVVQLVENADGAVIVTTPQELAVQDVRRCVSFCRHLKLPVLGVIENMSGFVCPACGEHAPIFGAGGGQSMAEEMKVPYLGSIPIDPTVVTSGDSGQPMVQAHPESETSKAFGRAVQRLIGSESIEMKTRTVLETKG